MEKTYEFSAVLHETPENGGAYVIFPWDIRKEFGKGRVRVNASFEEIPYQGSVVNTGVKDAKGNICYVLGVPKAIRQELQKHDGNVIRATVTVREDL